ncbi:MAG: DNA-processing protein DprA [Cocleimonas sp.]
MKTNDELKAWILLWRVPGVGSKTYEKLLAHFTDPVAVFNANTNTLKEAGLSQKLANTLYEFRDKDSADADIDWLNSDKNHTIITIQCSEYPTLLKQIDNPPPLLYIKGNHSLLNDPQLAIIGSRNPTRGGTDNAYSFAKHLGKTGLCITSGLALGIDGTAHKGALDADAPTIAVIATGIDRVYPATHRELAHNIVEQGAIVSEFPIGTQPKSENFPRRNRIISGLSYGTLVVEAALKSGSLITARLAMEQNREVFAIPSSIHNPLAKGCHLLIRQGAKLVETAEDILEEMADVINADLNLNTDNPLDKNTANINESAQENRKDNTTEYQELLDRMGFDPIPIDQLVIETGNSPEALSAMLLMLELQNKVSSNGGGTYTRLK